MTIYDIAKALNISYATVSMALNNHPKVAEKTRKTVQNYALEHGFSLDRRARNLRLQKESIVAIVVHDIASEFWAGIISTVENTLGGQYNLIVCNSGGSLEKEEQILKNLLSLRVCGIIIQPADYERVEHIKILYKAGMPVVLFENLPETGLPFVTSNDYQSGRMALTQLIAAGHRRIALLAHAEINVLGVIARKNGIIAATAAAADVKFEVFSMSLDEYAGVEAFVARMKDFSAVICLDDNIVILLLKYLNHKKMTFPNDLLLVTWRNQFEIDLVVHRVSYFEIPVREMGQMAAKYILQRLDNMQPQLGVLLDQPFFENR